MVSSTDITTVENVIRKRHEENGYFGIEKTAKIIKQQYCCDNLHELDELVCLVSDCKRGKKEGFLLPIKKEYQPLQTYHIDHMGPMTETSKLYRYIFGVTDSFSKFSWLYATKTVNAADFIKCLEMHQQVFCPPRRIVSDHGAALLHTFLVSIVITTKLITCS